MMTKQSAGPFIFQSNIYNENDKTLSEFFDDCKAGCGHRVLKTSPHPTTFSRGGGGEEEDME
jgi:hypothetical protein